MLVKGNPFLKLTKKHSKKCEYVLKQVKFLCFFLYIHKRYRKVPGDECTGGIEEKLNPVLLACPIKS